MTEGKQTIGECLNCGESLLDQKFCGNCGQRNTRRKLNILLLLGDMWSTITDLDNRFYRTVIELITRPGLMIADYVGGKRVRYLGPMQYFIITFAIVVVFGLPGFELTSMLTDPPEPIIGMPVRSEFWISIVSLVEEYTAIYVLLFSPFIAGVTWVIFPKSGRNYTEALVLMIFVLAQAFMFFTVVVGIGGIFSRSSIFEAMFTVLAFIGILPLYIAWTFSSFFGVSLLRGFLSGAFVTAVSFVILNYVYSTFFILIFTDELIEAA